jgi:hypothetical protein
MVSSLPDSGLARIWRQPSAVLLAVQLLGVLIYPGPN